MTTSGQPTARASVRRLVLVIFLARTILNTGYRAVYPFLPFIADDLHVSFQSAAEIIQSRNLIGLLAPFFGPFSDLYGRRTVMLAGVALAVVACLALGVFNAFAFAVIAIAGLSLGKAIFDPAQQAYLGDRIPYASRGRAIALSELSWSAAALLGLPLFGIVVKYAGWRAGFFALGLLGVLMLAIVRIGITQNERARPAEGRLFQRTFGLVFRSPMALALLASVVVNEASNENLAIVFGQWMNGAFSLDAVALGLVASAIGVAELGGEMVSTLWVDRIGKHRLVQVALLASSGAYTLLPLIGASALLATGSLVLVFFTFEITVVAAIPLISETLPTARATLLALNVAAVALGRAIGSFVGPVVFAGGGIGAIAWVSAGGALLTFLVWSLLVREHSV